MIATDIEQRAFIRKMQENPYDNTPRLIYADYLEDHGQGERAEFIRVCCRLRDKEERLILNKEQDGGDKFLDLIIRRRELFDQYYKEWFADFYDRVTINPPNKREQAAKGTFLVVRYGFIDEVYCTLEEIVGGEKECPNFQESMNEPDTNALVCCNQCEHTGVIQVEGIAANLFAQQPIKKVVITDKKPDKNPDSFWGPRNGLPWTFGEDTGYRINRTQEGILPQSAIIPQSIIELMEDDTEPKDKALGRGTIRWYRTEDRGFRELERVVLNYCRQLVGLDPISPRG